MVKKVALDDYSDQSDSSDAPIQLSNAAKASAKAKQSKLKVKERKSKISKADIQAAASLFKQQLAQNEIETLKEEHAIKTSKAEMARKINERKE